MSCFCPDIGWVANQVLAIVLIDVAVAFYALVRESDRRSLMVGIIEEMNIQVQQVADKECQQHCSVFTVISWIIEVLLDKIRFLIAELFAIGLIFECKLDKVQELVDSL